MRYLLELGRLMLRGLLLGFVELDRRLFPLFSPPVRLWSKWTGKSNFALARLLILVGCLVCIGGAVRFLLLLSAGLHPEKTASVIMLLIGFCWLMAVFHGIYKIEKLVRNAGGEILSRELYLQEVSFSFFRSAGLLFSAQVLWVFADEDFTLTLTSFFVLLLAIVALYILFHYNHGGKSRMREIIRQVVRQLSFAPIPSPAPVPLKTSLLARFFVIL